MTAASTTANDDRASAREQSGGRGWRFLVGLGMPALGLTFAVTVVSTYAPVLIGSKSSPLLVGAVVGGEGFFGLLVPLLAGTLSDRTSRIAQDRLRVILAVAPLSIGGLVLLMLPGGLGLVAAGAGLYFACHFAYLAPFQALYADLVPDERSGRSRSAESIWRLVGAGSALIAGGFLITAWQPSPFLVAAVLIAITTATFAWFLRRTEPVALDRESSGGERSDLRDAIATVRDVLHMQGVRAIVGANVFWNVTLSALRAFVVLFFIIGLGRSPAFVSGVVFPLVALGMAASAPVCGKLADKFGPIRVLRVAVPVSGLGLLLPAFWQAAWVLGFVPVVAAATATVMIVPFAALMRMMPAQDHGAISGVFTFSRGLGTMLGPLLAGLAVDVMRSTLTSTHGYAAMWIVIGGATLLTWPFLTRARDGQR